LRETSGATAEQAFSVSCLMSIFIIVLIAVATLFISHWLTSVIVLVFGGLVGLGVSSFLANRSHTGNLKITFQREIEPRIQLVLEEYDLSPDEFVDLVHQVLPQESPLIERINQQPYGSES
ncbi:MAG: hypothetical protein GWN30_00610, partial [Gammaproteobacteria bacterium]|nr:hypothetical protein [Gammaproteobacteria bacterium]